MSSLMRRLKAERRHSEPRPPCRFFQVILYLLQPQSLRFPHPCRFPSNNFFFSPSMMINLFASRFFVSLFVFRLVVEACIGCILCCGSMVRLWFVWPTSVVSIEGKRFESRRLCSCAARVPFLLTASTSVFHSAAFFLRKRV